MGQVTAQVFGVPLYGAHLTLETLEGGWYWGKKGRKQGVAVSCSLDYTGQQLGVSDAEQIQYHNVTHPTIVSRSSNIPRGSEMSSCLKCAAMSTHRWTRGRSSTFWVGSPKNPSIMSSTDSSERDQESL